MYLHTRLLIGIAVVTLIALAVSVLAPLVSARAEISRETGGSLELARLLLDAQRSAENAADSAAARSAAADKVALATTLRHVTVTLRDPAGHELASSPTDLAVGGWLTRSLAPNGVRAVLDFPLTYHGAEAGTLKITSYPLSELAEIEQRAARDLVLLVLTILAMSVATYATVRRGLKPVGSILSALRHLEAGDLGTRLPRLPVLDLDEISRQFNHCAAVMQRASMERRELALRLIEVEEEERRRLARELHDELGQSLTAIKVDAAYIARESAGRAPHVETCARGIEKLSTEIMALIRGMLARLRPYALESVGLRASLGELVSSWQARPGSRLHCALSLVGPIDDLTPDLNIAIYRLVQECLTNAVRHSAARSLSIRVTAENPAPAGQAPRVTVQMAEEGAPPAEVNDAAHTAGSGTGLLGMRERVQARGGELTLGASASGGFALTAWMPLVTRNVVTAHG